MFSKKKDKKNSSASKSPVSPKVRDYGNEAYFARKAEAAREVVEKYGLPKQLQTEKK